jgi:fermentation-respiration switch protein FrsA (DUF1100 family)
VRSFWLVTVLVSLSAACAHRLPGAGATLRSDESLQLHGRDLTLHFSRPDGPLPASRLPVLLVYATGDAGWWGKDRDIFSHIRGWGYPAVGFSARQYVHHLGSESVTPAQVAADFEAVIRSAEAALALPPSTRAVLVGKSRGAGLAVAAAGRASLRPQLAGVLAIGLTREEEYVHRRFRRRSNHPVMLQTYGYLPRIGNVPVAVIQSTGDDYVPAAEARRLFGPDTAVRELVPIDSRDHNFGGALDRLYLEIERSLHWLVER